MMKLFTVVIADDDALVLEDLKSLVDWVKLGFMIQAVAANGNAAFDYVKKYKPDLLITDILMPGITGLELIEKVQQIHPEIKIMIISSYGEFDYAKKAISLDVHDYLLKNEITAASFTKKLAELADTISKNSRTSQFLMQQNLALFFQQAEAAEETMFLLPDKNRYYFFAITQELPFLFDIQQSNHVIDASRQFLTQTLSQLEKEQLLMPIRFANEHLLIFAVQIESSTKEQHFLLRSLRQKIWILLQSHSPHPCALFYHPEPLRLTEFRSLYRLCLPQLRFFSAFCPPKPVTLLELQPSDTASNKTRLFSFQALTATSAHLDESIFAMKDFLTQCYQKQDLPAMQEFYRNFCVNVTLLTQNQIRFTEPLYVASPEALLKWYFNTWESVVFLLEHEKNVTFSQPIKTALNFMEEHFFDHALTSEIISRHVGLSSGRLGVLFKAETNCTINEYLTKMRIDEAVYLLKNTNLKIYEITEKCGYTSSQYFSQIFYQKTGKRPIDYRKNN